MRMLLGVLQCHRDAQKSHAGADAGYARDGLTMGAARPDRDDDRNLDNSEIKISIFILLTN
jgi:hypothetical protein